MHLIYIVTGMPPRRPCKRQPPSPAMASPAFSVESKRTDVRPSPGQAISRVNHRPAIETTTNSGSSVLSSQFRQQHSTHNVKGRCPIEMNLACRGSWIPFFASPSYFLPPTRLHLMHQIHPHISNLSYIINSRTYDFTPVSRLREKLQGPQAPQERTHKGEV